ncbi:MAG TPA: hypothetical protein VF598_13890 [Hymenobacter sp.]|jgi:hypothetical protein
MNLRVFFVLLIMGLATASQAQVSTSAPDKNFTHQDSVQAIQRLYHTQRLGGVLYAIVGTGITALWISTLNDESTDGNSSAQSLLSSVAGGAGGGMLAGGIIGNIQFNRKHERQVLTDFQAGKPLPDHVWRALVPKYFK